MAALGSRLLSVTRMQCVVLKEAIDISRGCSDFHAGRGGYVLLPANAGRGLCASFTCRWSVCRVSSAWSRIWVRVPA